MLDILLMVVIGGMGTGYGAVIGATLLVLAQSYLQGLMTMASEAAAALPLAPALLAPNRWLLWLGLIFVLPVYILPQRHRGPAAVAAAIDAAKAAAPRGPAQPRLPRPGAGAPARRRLPGRGHDVAVGVRQGWPRPVDTGRWPLQPLKKASLIEARWWKRGGT